MRRDRIRLRCLWLLTLVFFSDSLQASSSLASISRQAQARWAVHDYLEASRLYEDLLNQPMAEWQQARLYYNLGTLRLAQHHPLEAFTFFKKCVPASLSLPLFGRNLLINEGIGNLQQIDSSDPFNLALFFIRQARNIFTQANALNCEIQKQEQGSAPSSICLSSPLLDAWIKQTNYLFQENIKYKQRAWLNEASKEQMAALLHQQLQEIAERFKRETLIDSPLLSYFHQALDTLTPLWSILQNRSFSSEQTASFNQAIDAFLIALQETNEKALLTHIAASQEALARLSFQKDVALQKAVLHYQLILLAPSLSAFPLQTLQHAFDKLTVPKEQADSLHSLQSLLEKSVQAFNSHQLVGAQFFLLAGFSKAENFLPQKNQGSADLLKKAIDQAKRTLQLTFLAEELEKKEDSLSEIRKNLEEGQQEVLIRAKPFIPAALAEQRQKFSLHDCQQSPWEHVIPLFDRGYQTAQLAEKTLQTSAFKFSTLFGQQEHTIQNWENALHLLLHPPLPSEETSTSASSIKETLRLLQEMYQEDQSLPEQQMNELHTW